MELIIAYLPFFRMAYVLHNAIKKAGSMIDRKKAGGVDCHVVFIMMAGKYNYLRSDACVRIRLLW